MVTTVITWNIEGFHRNLHSLNHFITEHQPGLIFLTEPQTFQHDLPLLLQTFRGELSCHLNSEDLHQPELAMETSRAKGGTMALWRSSLDPFITIIPTGTSSILALILQPPRHAPSIHICLYFPTAGKDPEYVVELSKLEVLLEELSDKYPGVPVYFRGDGNANMKNQPRATLFRSSTGGMEMQM